jgi:hypothetical protein
MTPADISVPVPVEFHRRLAARVRRMVGELPDDAADRFESLWHAGIPSWRIDLDDRVAVVVVTVSTAAESRDVLRVPLAELGVVASADRIRLVA